MSRLHVASAALLILVALLACGLTNASASLSTITFTGQILNNGAPVANGVYDLEFSLFTAGNGGTQVGSTISVASVTVADGVFNVALNFGSTVFTGAALYIQTSYRLHPKSGNPSYTMETPRNLVPSSTYADYAAVSGSTDALQGKAVSTTAPATGQILMWTGSAWTPQASPAATAYTAGAGLALTGHAFSIPASGITSTMLSKGSVTSTALAAGAVTQPAIKVPLTLSDSSATPVVYAINTGVGAALYGKTATGSGVYGTCVASNAFGLLGGTDPYQYEDVGVYGQSDGEGVSGYSSSAGGYGTAGFCNAGTGVYGQTASGNGVRGTDTGNNDYGLLGGVEPISGNNVPIGVFGFDSNTGYGVYGQGTNGPGIRGVSTNSDGGDFFANGSAVGVFAQSASGVGGYFGGGGDGQGIDVTSVNGYGGEFTTEAAVGVFVTAGNADGGDFTSNSGGYGISAYGAMGAGYFNGNIVVTGSVTNAGASLRIDHPLDPANEYLNHASVESDEMKDMYDGNVVTDGNGDAVVKMPAWFQSLNTEFRYQLTVIGQFAQAIISSELANNQFSIKTDKPNVKVSWQVTGVRHDAYSNAHPLNVEQVKPESERGLYQDPVEWGQPESKGIGYAHQQSMLAKGKRAMK
jgi:hypothetical protein